MPKVRKIAIHSTLPCSRAHTITLPMFTTLSVLQIPLRPVRSTVIRCRGAQVSQQPSNALLLYTCRRSAHRELISQAQAQFMIFEAVPEAAAWWYCTIYTAGPETHLLAR